MAHLNWYILLEFVVDRNGQATYQFVQTF